MIESRDFDQPVGVIAGFILLAVRGLLLWIAVPLGFVAWVVLALWLLPRGIRLGQFLGWVDLNLVATLERTVLRALFRHPLSWVSVRDIGKVRHRIGMLDPA